MLYDPKLYLRRRVLFLRSSPSTFQISGHSTVAAAQPHSVQPPVLTAAFILLRESHKAATSMGKKGGAKNLPKSELKPQNRITLREEATGKLKTKPIVNTKSHLRIDHLKNLALWATTDPNIPSLSAFYGRQLAAVSEASGVAPDPSLITCQRFVFFCYIYA